MAQNRVSDVSAADWLSRAVIRFFSKVEIPIKQSSLHNKIKVFFFNIKNYCGHTTKCTLLFPLNVHFVGLSLQENRVLNALLCEHPGK